MDPRTLIIFDLDGTLFRTETASVPAVQESFRRFGLPVPAAEEVCAFFGKPGSEFHAWLRTRCPEGLTATLVAAVDALELEMIDQGELYPGVREALAELQAEGARLAICSNGPRNYVERVLNAHRIAPFFTAVRYRRSAEDTKPDMARELLQQLQAGPALVIGDRIEDVEAAHQNGLPAIAAAYGYGPPAERAAAEAQANSPDELPGLVQMLLAPNDPL